MPNLKAVYPLLRYYYKLMDDIAKRKLVAVKKLIQDKQY